MLHRNSTEFLVIAVLILGVLCGLLLALVILEFDTARTARQTESVAVQPSRPVLELNE